MTWEDVKRQALQLMFTYSVDGKINTDPSNEDFKIALASTANAAMNQLARVCPIERTLVIRQNARENVLSDFVQEETESSAIASRAVSFYAEVDGAAQVFYETLSADGTYVQIDSEEIDHHGYLPVRYNFDIAGPVRVRFSGTIGIRNVAMYGEKYENKWEIQSPGEVQTYSLAQLCSHNHQLRFMRMHAEKPVRYETRDISGYVRFDGIDTLMIPTEFQGEIRVHYDAYPTQMTQETPDDFEIELPLQAQDAIALYVASMLYAEDDIVIATQYRNEFDARKQELMDAPNKTFMPDAFISESGWW